MSTARIDQRALSVLHVWSNIRRRSERGALTCFRFPIRSSTPAPWVSVPPQSGASHLLAIKAVRRAIARRRHDRPSDRGARFALRVDVRRGPRSEHATLFGHAQADAAAAGAAGVARFLIENGVSEPGAWMPEQIIDPGPFLSRLAVRGLKVEFSIR